MTKKERAILIRHIKFNKKIYDDAYCLHADCQSAENLEEKNLVCARYCESTTMFYLLTGEHWCDIERVGGES